MGPNLIHLCIPIPHISVQLMFTELIVGECDWAGNIT